MIGFLLSLMAQPVVVMTDPECPALEASLIPVLPSQLGGTLMGSRGPQGELIVELRPEAGAMQVRRELAGSPTCEGRARQILLLVQAWTMDLTPLSQTPAIRPRPIPAKGGPSTSRLPSNRRPSAASPGSAPRPASAAPQLELATPKTSDRTLVQEPGPVLTMRVDFESDAPLEPAIPSFERAEAPASGRSWGWALVGGTAIAGGLVLHVVDDGGRVAGSFLPVSLVATGACMLIGSLVGP